MKFAEYNQFNLSEINKEVLKRWDENQVFDKSMTTREGHPSFVFYEGPPSANGMPGIHHVMARSIKDIFCRFKTMKGYQVKRKAGWDTHGLPVELGVEKMLGITKEDIGKKISVDDYNAACRKEVMKYTKEWTDLTHKMGYWVDLDDPYITYDNRYIETLWWMLKQLYGKGLLYKGYTIQPYSPGAGTGLSSHELNQPGCYRDVKDMTATAIFEVADNGLSAIENAAALKEWGKLAVLAWTTTPWTLPSNTALCVGPNIDYVAAQTFNPYNGDKLTVIIAEPRLKAYLAGDELQTLAEMEALDIEKVDGKKLPYRIVARFKGTDLEGIHYNQLMPWVKPCEKVDDLSAAFVSKYAAEHPEKVFSHGQDKFVECADCAFRVILGDYVTTEDGTGIVHIAPTFGADDAKVAKAADIPGLYMINKLGETRPMVDMTGKYYVCEELAESFVEKCVNRAEYGVHEGDFVKNAYAPKYNEGGKYNAEAAAKDDDLNIVMSLEMKKAGQCFRMEKHVHNYPHCWRTDKPVLYYPLDSWFIRSTACRDRMIELNKTINWKPKSTGTGRFGMWLENLNDWNLSRSRYWGTPLPIWRNRDTREELCIGSVEELYNEIEKAVAAGVMASNPYKEKGFVPGLMTKENYDKIDLHRPYVDDIKLVSESGNVLTRELDLIDVWFDSGAMPYAQIHYPFENKEAFDNRTIYPADFIAEGVDQTRGWFFTLHALGTMIFDSVAYKAVVSNGLVLAKDGQKMSKRLGNAIDPFGAIEKYGSDPLRWYMITNASPWDNLKFDPEGVSEVSRKFFGTLFNTYKLFALYANIDGFTGNENEVPVEKRPEIDRWILSSLSTLISEVEKNYETYEPTQAGRLIETFVCDNLSNWYVRLNRKRFWGGELNDDKLAAYQTLYTCLETVAKLMAPIAPFYADKLFCDLNAVSGRDANVSVHLADFPVAGKTDEALERKMQLAQTVTSLVLSIRKTSKINVRQPLQTILFPAVDAEQEQDVLAVKDLILSEVNVKELKIAGGEDHVLVKRVKPNFRELGKRYGKLMKSLAAALNDLTQEQIASLEKTGSVNFELEGTAVEILTGDVEIISEDMPGWNVASEGRVTVALDVTITEALKCEGVARELIKRIQNHRKTAGFEVTDRIQICVESNAETDEAVKTFGDYIASQVLATSIEVVAAGSLADAVELDMDEYVVRAQIKK
ncbi:MAG: isoleucine--tRNA ligase [Bacteroidales bacterium]|nr:isoleucine--tRNA ligase [Candidatus Liminaster caballi]